VGLNQSPRAGTCYSFKLVVITGPNSTLTIYPILILMLFNSFAGVTTISALPISIWGDDNSRPSLLTSLQNSGNDVPNLLFFRACLFLAMQEVIRPDMASVPCSSHLHPIPRLNHSILCPRTPRVIIVSRYRHLVWASSPMLSRPTRPNSAFLGYFRPDFEDHSS